MADFHSTNPYALQVVRETLAQLRSVPALTERYSDVVCLDSLEDLVHIPIMVKDDLNVALDHLKPRARQGATWTFQSGGTTGSPKLGVAPTGLYMTEVYEHWAALGPDDIFVNGWVAGKLWGAHFLMTAYADHARCVGMNLGSVDRVEYDTWLEFCADRRVTAYGGTPSALRLLFQRAHEAGIKLPDLKKILFLGEAWHPVLDEYLSTVAPQARRWGLFGSTETWVVATNTPECAADTWHPLPSQLVHIGENQILDFTSLKPDGLNPVLRYQTGDAGEWVNCSCRSGERALRLLGRRDGFIKFRGIPFNVDEMIAEFNGQPGVSMSQVVVTEFPHSAPLMDLLVVASRDAPSDLADRLRAYLVSSGFGPSSAFLRSPESLAIRLVDALITNERTGKTSNLVLRQAS